MKIRENINVSQKPAHYYSKKFNRFFNAFKSKSVQRPDSYLEVCGLRELEFDDSVETYKAQPKSYIFKYKGQYCRYTPDFLVKFTNGSYEFRELKVAHRFNDEKVQDRLSVLKEYFLDRYNIPLVEWRDTDFNQGRRIENLSRLYRYKFFDLKCFNLNIIKTQLSAVKSLGDVYSMISTFNCTNALAPALIAQQHVTTDLSLPFSPQNFAEVK